MQRISFPCLEMTAYRLAGLNILSDLLLPGLRPCLEYMSGADAIVIQRALLPELLSDSDRRVSRRPLQ